MAERGKEKALASQSNSSNLFQKPHLITSVYGSLATTSTRKAGKYFIAEDTDSPDNKGDLLEKEMDVEQATSSLCYRDPGPSLLLCFYNT